MARPTAYPIKKIVGFEQVMLDAIDEFRRGQKPLPNQSEAIRNILAIWLTEQGYLKGSK